MTDAAGLSSPPTVDEIAEALQADPVLVDQRFGNGHTDEVVDGFRDLADGAEHPVYVVLAAEPDGLAAADPAADLASRLHDDLGGGDATFVVHLGAQSYGNELVGFGDAPGADELSAGRPGGTFGGGEDEGVSVAGVAARDLETALSGTEMTEDAWSSYASEQPWAQTETWEAGAEVPGPADAVFAPALLAVAVAGVAWLVIDQALRWREAPAGPAVRGRPARRGAVSRTRRRPDDLTGAEAPAVRRILEAELDELAVAVAAATGRDDLTPERRERLEGSADTARRLADRLPADPGAEHLADALGALVLVRVAAREAGASGPSGSAPTPYRACALDPRHGEADGTRDLPVADRTLELDVCDACRRASAADVAVLEVPGGGGRRRPGPYLATDSVWAATGFGSFVDELWPHVATDLRERR